MARKMRRQKEECRDVRSVKIRMFAKENNKGKGRQAMCGRMWCVVGLFCAMLAISWGGREAQAWQKPEAMERLERACKQGDGAACWAWAEEQEKRRLSGIRIAVSKRRQEVSFWKRGRVLLESACARGEGKACWHVGGAYYNGKTVKQSAKRAMSYLLKACQAQHAEACDFAGILYGNGAGATQDLRMARRLHGKACRMGSMDGCVHLGGLFLRGLGGPQNLYEARQRFVQACQAGRHGHGCTLLAEMQIRGEGGSQNVKGAMKTYLRACALGAKVGCERYQEMSRILRPAPTPPRRFPMDGP